MKTGLPAVKRAVPFHQLPLILKKGKVDFVVSAAH
jgi:hypothetical protein